MKFVIAPDSFKGSLSANEVCAAIERGLKKVIPTADIVNLPMADGGEGTVEALVSSTGGHLEWTVVHDPLGQKIQAHYGILGDQRTAVIEMAAASGLPLVPLEKRNPLFTSTYGTGELILAAAHKGCRQFIIGIGGSATTDGGTGMAQALGVKFRDQSGQEITSQMNGDGLGKIRAIELASLNPVIHECQFTVACDVENPLLGPQGCAHVYGPQKGATPAIVAQLEQNMTHFANILETTIGRTVRDLPGAGAAGGLGAGLMAFVQGALKRGIEIVLQASHFTEQIQGADLIFTGEGRIDFQTAFGKTLSGVAREAKKQGIPVIALGGMVDDHIDNLYAMGIHSFFSICNRPMDLPTAMKNTAHLLELASERVLRAVLISVDAQP
ncbi:glycerate kinase [candidate division KSB1 bacterium]|nr:glycerate kinase [candidate division KSB1 bacterium]